MIDFQAQALHRSSRCSCRQTSRAGREPRSRTSHQLEQTNYNLSKITRPAIKPTDSKQSFGSSDDKTVVGRVPYFSEDDTAKDEENVEWNAVVS